MLARLLNGRLALNSRKLYGTEEAHKKTFLAHLCTFNGMTPLTINVNEHEQISGGVVRNCMVLALSFTDGFLTKENQTVAVAYTILALELDWGGRLLAFASSTTDEVVA